MHVSYIIVYYIVYHIIYYIVYDLPGGSSLGNDAWADQKGSTAAAPWACHRKARSPTEWLQRCRLGAEVTLCARNEVVL